VDVGSGKSQDELCYSAWQ